MKTEIVGQSLPKIPWEERTPGTENDVMWRYSGNPVVERDIIPSSNSVFNSAIIPFEDGFVGIFRCDYRTRFANLHFGRSIDGFSWIIDREKIFFHSVWRI